MIQDKLSPQRRKERRGPQRKPESYPVSLRPLHLCAFAVKNQAFQLDAAPDFQQNIRYHGVLLPCRTITRNE
jgi:hypothetical protein